MLPEARQFFSNSDKTPVSEGTEGKCYLVNMSLSRLWCQLCKAVETEDGGKAGNDA